MHPNLESVYSQNGKDTESLHGGGGSGNWALKQKQKFEMLEGRRKVFLVRKRVCQPEVKNQRPGQEMISEAEGL